MEEALKTERLLEKDKMTDYYKMLNSCNMETK